MHAFSIVGLLAALGVLAVASACRSTPTHDHAELKDVLTDGYPKVIRSTNELTFKRNIKLLDGEPQQFARAGYKAEANCVQLGQYEKRWEYVVIGDGPCPEQGLLAQPRFVLAKAVSPLTKMQSSVHLHTSRGWVQVAYAAEDILFGLCSSLSGEGQDNQFLTGINCDVVIDAKSGVLREISIKAKARVSIPAPTQPTAK